jgi:hypothetical protein
MTILVRELSVRVEIDARSSTPPASTAQTQKQTPPKIQQRQALQQALRQCQEYKRW